MSGLSLLGPLETEIMEVMWQKGHATVRQVVDALIVRRSVAYTTAMTVMNNLASKGLLKRVSLGKAYDYRVALTPEAFLEKASKKAERYSRTLRRLSSCAFYTSTC